MCRRRSGKRHHSQAGMTLIEVMFSLVILTICLLGVVPLVMTSIGNNGRSKFDSTSTMLAQGVLEQIDATLSGGGPPDITDCQPHAWAVSTDPGGADLNSDNSAIDFTKPIDTSTGYAMKYQVCPGTVAGADNVPITYDVRWNIQELTNQVGVATKTYVVIVGAKPINTGAKRFTFNLPITMRLYTGRHK